MGQITTQAASVFRDMVSPGSSVPNEPSKPEIRALFGAVDEAISAAADLAVQGVRWTTSAVRVRSTGNVSIASGLENGDTLNGVTLATGDVVFLGLQTDPSQNGLWTVVASGAASRATFADTAAELAYIGFVIGEGSAGAGERWTLQLPEDQITVGTTPLNFSRIGIEVSYADAIDARLDPLEASGALIANIAGGSTDSAYVTTPRTGTVTEYQAGKLYVFVPNVTNSNNPTLKIGDGPAVQLADSNEGVLAAGRLIAGRPVIVMYQTGFGGYFRIVSAPEITQIRPLAAAGTANAITGASELPLSPIPAYSESLLFVMRLVASATTSVPTLAVDGLAALGIYDSRGEVADRRIFREGNYLFLRYSSNFGGYWQILSPQRLPDAPSAAFEGIQRADEAASAVRDIYSLVRPPVSLDPTPIYNNTFSSSGDVDGFISVKGIGPTLAIGGAPDYTEVALDWSADSGGCAVSSAIATAGSESWWWDWNHVWPGPGYLQLLAVGNSAALSSGPLPNIPDLRNCRVTLDLEAVDLFLPDGARLVFHWQGYDLSVANGGTGKTINYHWHEPLDVNLGSLGLGKGVPPHINSGTGRLLNGTATIVIDFVPNDAFWRCIGTSRLREDAYAFAPVERVMRAALTSGAASSYLNMHIQVVHPQQYGHANGASQPPVERAYGELRIRSWKIEEPA